MKIVCVFRTIAFAATGVIVLLWKSSGTSSKKCLSLPTMKRQMFTTLLVFHCVISFSQEYQGRPWNSKPQEIPGKLQCEWYDEGGEGIGYHDADSINNGSGKLNPANGTFLNEFRMREGVDISYTKPAPIDVHPYNQVEPIINQMYVGWTEPGEWINYTINVRRTGTYTLALMYTASGDGEISLLIDAKKLTDNVLILSTRNENETIEWRQWHHWNRIDSLATVRLEKGFHLLTLKTENHGNMNYDYFDFQLKK